MGLVATSAHIVIAILVKTRLGIAANLAGFLAAIGFSYVGHAFLTFGRPAGHAVHLPRFLALSLAGLLLSSGITFLVCIVMSGPFLVAQVAVAGTVPTLTFLGSRLWVFAQAAPRQV